MAPWGDRNTAYHEAGHAVVAVWLDGPLDSVTIVTDTTSATAGVAATPFESDFYPGDGPQDFERSLNRITVLLAGAAAERLLTRRVAGGRSDRHEAWRLATEVCNSDKEADQLLKWLRCRARALIEKLRPAVDAIAEMLLAQGTVSGEQVREVGRRLFFSPPAPE